MSDDLAGKRILIVEDEYFAASDLQRAFHQAEAIVVGPVGSVETGLSLIDDAPLDAAVLDVNLDGAMSYPIAQRLTACAVPFVFLTGYDRWALPENYRDIARITKPTPIAAVVDVVGRMVTTGAAG